MKFYKLTVEEVENTATKLNRAEILVLYWLKSQDPYGHSSKIDTSEIAEALKINRRTVQRSLVGLDHKGLIELEVSTFSFKWKDAIDLSSGDRNAADDEHNYAIDLSSGDRNAAKNRRSICRQAIEMPPQAIDLSPQAIVLSPTTAETLTGQGTCEAKNNKEFKDLSLSESAIGNSDFSENEGVLKHLFLKPLSPLEQPPEQDDEGLIAFVISQIGKGANNPRAYAKAALKNDRIYWNAEFERSKTPQTIGETPQTIGETPQTVIAEPFGSEPRPQPAIEVVNDREAVLARAAGLLEMGRSPAMANFAQQRLRKLIDEHDITPEELKDYLGQKTQDSENVCEVVHPMEVPALAGVNVPQEYADRCKAAQWAHFMGGGQ